MGEKKKEPPLNPQVLENLREATRLESVLKNGGWTVRFWEVYALVHGGVLPIGGETPPDDPFPGLAERLETLRKDPGPTIDAVRSILPRSASSGDGPVAHQEWTLGMIAVSDRALENARRWTADPKSHAQEAAFKIRILEGIVLRYRLSLQFPKVTAGTFMEEDVGPARDTGAETVAPPEPVVPIKAPSVPPPAAPRGLKATAESNGILLEWPEVAGATRYKVMRARERRGPYKPIAMPKASRYQDARIRKETPYYYAVKALNEGGQSGPSNRIQMRLADRAPMRPLGLESSAGNAQAFLFWTASVGAAEYRVKRSDRSGGPYQEAGRASEPLFVEGDLENGKTYFYVVTAARGGAESEPSPETHVTPAPTAVPDGEAGSRVMSRVPELPEGVDYDAILDLRRYDQLNFVFEDVAEGLELWEVLTFLADGGGHARNRLDQLVVLKEQSDGQAFQEGAISLLEDILSIRTQHASLLVKLRAYLDLSRVPDEDRDLIDLAVAMMVSGAGARHRTEAWFENPDAYETEAADLLQENIGRARNYFEALATWEN